jgi:hypothetical protein
MLTNLFDIANPYTNAKPPGRKPPEYQKETGENQ